MGYLSIERPTDNRSRAALVTADRLGHWSPLALDELHSLLAAATFPWWVAGGWALDLFVGRRTRPHDDLDVAVLRKDLDAVVGELPGWEVHVAAGGKLRSFAAGEELGPDEHDLWCRPAPGAGWALQLMLNESEGDRWICRRNPSISQPLAEVGRRSASGLPYLAPEVQLLFKAKDPRPKDELDFEVVLPCLDDLSRAWLSAAIAATHPGHAWLSRL